MVTFVPLQDASAQRTTSPELAVVVNGYGLVSVVDSPEHWFRPSATVELAQPMTSPMLFVVVNSNAGFGVTVIQGMVSTFRVQALADVVV
jgi:hypothetical protein